MLLFSLVQSKSCIFSKTTKVSNILCYFMLKTRFIIWFFVETISFDRCCLLWLDVIVSQYMSILLTKSLCTISLFIIALFNDKTRQNKSFSALNCSIEYFLSGKHNLRILRKQNIIPRIIKSKWLFQFFIYYYSQISKIFDIFPKEIFLCRNKINFLYFLRQ